MSEEAIDGIGNVRRIIKGSLISIVITIVLLIIYSAVLTYTNISESTIPMVTITITGVSILIGSQIAASHIKKNGLVAGMAIGGIYMLTIYLLSSIISGNFGMSFFSILMIIVAIVTGAFRRHNWCKQKII